MSHLTLSIFLSILFAGLTACAQAKAVIPEETAAKKATSQKQTPKRNINTASRRAASKAPSNIKAVKRAKPVKKLADANRKRRVTHQRLAYAAAPVVASSGATAGDIANLHLTRDPLALKSNVALVMDQKTSQVLFEKNGNVPLPVASITKLMTAIVVIEARQPLDEVLEVTADDIDRERHSASRLRVGAQMTRDDMLHIALMSSENRAASALGRHYPGGLPAFVAAMNAKAKALGMHDTRYVDTTGLSSNNVSSARDLAKLVIAAYQHPIIREYSTDSKYTVKSGKSMLHYVNSNSLIGNAGWNIGLQKTGYINEAGRCLVMQTRIEGRPVVMIFLDSKGKLSRIGDAGRIRKWLESEKPQILSSFAKPQG